MTSLKKILFLGLLALHSEAVPTTSKACTDYGSWEIGIITGASATGYRFGDLYAQHSKNPGVISHSKWLYSPEFQNTTFTTDDPTLSNSLLDSLGVQGKHLERM
jgi:hypothetical protein